MNLPNPTVCSYLNVNVAVCPAMIKNTQLSVEEKIVISAGKCQYKAKQQQRRVHKALLE